MKDPIIFTGENLPQPKKKVPEHEGSRQLSVRLDIGRYKKLKLAADHYHMTHRDIMIEGLDLWLKSKNID